MEVSVGVGRERVTMVGTGVSVTLGTEATEDWPEGGTVVAEAAKLLGGEGCEEELADGGCVVGLCLVAHG